MYSHILDTFPLKFLLSNPIVQHNVYVHNANTKFQYNIFFSLEQISGNIPALVLIAYKLKSRQTDSFFLFQNSVCNVPNRYNQNLNFSMPNINLLIRKMMDSILKYFLQCYPWYIPNPTHFHRNLFSPPHQHTKECTSRLTAFYIFYELLQQF